MKAVIAGGTGLIGHHLVNELSRDAQFEKLTVMSRRPVTTVHPKLINRVVDFNNLSQVATAFDKADVIFSAVGTTQKQVQGDEAAYRKVDYDIPLSLATYGLQKQVHTFILVSSVGADRKSKNFYLRLKGEVEEAICAFPFESIYIFRPSILLGNRNEFRMGESIGKAIMRGASILMMGSLRKYHAVWALDVARAMIAAAKEKKPGVNILYYDDMMKLTRGGLPYHVTS